MADKKPDPTIKEILSNPDLYPEEVAKLNAAGRKTWKAVEDAFAKWDKFVAKYADARGITEEESAELLQNLARQEDNSILSPAEFEQHVFSDLLQKVTYQKTHNLEMNIDKVVSVFFGITAPDPRKDIDGQMSFTDLIPVKYENDSSSKEINLYYNFDQNDTVFSKLNLPKGIESEDYFILSLLQNEYASNNKVISASKLYRELNGCDPNSDQLSEFTKSLVKLKATQLIMNDDQVRNAWNTDTGKEEAVRRVGITSLAPIDIVYDQFIASGKIAATGIIIMSEPRILQVGRAIGQYTTIKKSLLQVKTKSGRRIKKTKRFWRAMLFLIKEISRMKSGRRSSKILYSTYYSSLGDTSTRDTQLAKNMLFVILDHFVAENYISGYKEETTKSTGEVGVKIKYNTPKAIEKKK